MFVLDLLDLLFKLVMFGVVYLLLLRWFLVLGLLVVACWVLFGV